MENRKEFSPPKKDNQFYSSIVTSNRMAEPRRQKFHLKLLVLLVGRKTNS